MTWLPEPMEQFWNLAAVRIVPARVCGRAWMGVAFPCTPGAQKPGRYDPFEDAIATRVGISYYVG